MDKGVLYATRLSQGIQSFLVIHTPCLGGECHRINVLSGSVRMLKWDGSGLYCGLEGTRVANRVRYW